MQRPKYHDLIPGDFGAQLAPYDFVELKYDGLYAEFIGNADGWSIHGRNGDLLRYGEDQFPECYVQGEFIDGTAWAKSSPLFGTFVMWNVIYSGLAAPSFVDYESMRLVMADVFDECEGRLFGVQKVGGSQFCRVGNAAQMWRDNPGWEGLIFRSADGMRYGRMKRIVTMDYVCVGVRREGPRATALHGGLWIDGRLETVCTVPIKSPAEQCVRGAKPDRVIGAVFEARGNAVFKSGALRNPRQAGPNGSVKWRTDKAPKDCVL